MLWSVSHSVMSDSLQPIDCSLPGSSLHGILQARILEWVAIYYPAHVFRDVLFSISQNTELFLLFYRLNFCRVGVRGASQMAHGKESACQCMRYRRCGFHPWFRKIPWRRRWQPTPVLLLRESHGQRSLVGYNPQGHKELDMTKET